MGLGPTGLELALPYKLLKNPETINMFFLIHVKIGIIIVYSFGGS